MEQERGLTPLTEPNTNVRCFHGGPMTPTAAAVPAPSTTMTSFKSPDPLHGVTLERLLTELVAQYGWEELGQRVPIRCFTHDPSIKSSLTFLRKTPWARAKVEDIYIRWKLTGK